MNIRFRCPVCEHASSVQLPGASSWQCPACDHRLQLAASEEDGKLDACLICDTKELYKKKDFPHWLGLLILTVACLASIIPYWLYHQWLTWTILIGSAAFDGLLYLWVGDVVVCYRCQAHYRGFSKQHAHSPFELGVAERYRQERLRQEHLRREASEPRSRPH